MFGKIKMEIIGTLIGNQVMPSEVDLFIDYQIKYLRRDTGTSTALVHLEFDKKGRAIDMDSDSFLISIIVLVGIIVILGLYLYNSIGKLIQNLESYRY
jgi:small-conductance mechanosensitive channel